MDLLEKVHSLKDSLLDLIEPDYGLLEELTALQVLTDREMQKVRSEKTAFEKTDRLIDYMTTEEQCVRLLEALQKIGQSHIVNFINSNGSK